MKTAFVTGGSGDIGSAVCVALAAKGYAVAVGYCKNKGRAEKVCENIRIGGGVAAAVRCDISDMISVQKSVQIIKEQLGSPQVLINNAGSADIGLFTDLSDEKLVRIINENLVGAMLLTKALLPDMIKRHYGKIVNISSVWGEVGASCEVAYSAAKAGLIGFTKALAKEVAPSGINVNCISAGLIDTKMNSELSAEELTAIIDEIPAGRAGTPEDIANAVMFLISEQAQYLNGQTTRIDGAWC